MTATSRTRSCTSAAEVRRKHEARRCAREFGSRVRRCRKTLRISQEKLGERSGLHRTYIGHVERGELNPTLHNVVLVAEGLGVDPCELVRGLRTRSPDEASVPG
jgi:transcriptional regulator with XRE-family HTH domain